MGSAEREAEEEPVRSRQNDRLTDRGDCEDQEDESPTSLSLLSSVRASWPVGQECAFTMTYSMWLVGSSKLHATDTRYSTYREIR